MDLKKCSSESKDFVSILDIQTRELHETLIQPQVKFENVFYPKNYRFTNRKELKGNG